MRTSDAHSCSCFHKLDNIANSDQDQSHIHDNECLNGLLVECSLSVVEASSAAASVAVVANPSEGLRHQERLVADELVVVDEVAVTVLVCGLEQLGEEGMTSFVQPRKKQTLSLIHI